MIIFAEVMFDEKISGELPEHIDFIKNKCIPLFNEWGYETKILHSEKHIWIVLIRLLKNQENIRKTREKEKVFQWRENVT